MKDQNKNPDLKKRDKPDDYFGDWKWREGLAELMVPIVGKLYRDGINILMYGNSLVNQSPTDIMKSHRFIRRVEDSEISELETYPFLKYLETQDLSDCEIDLGEIVVDFMNENVSFDEQNIEQYIQNHVVQPLSTTTNTRPDTPKDIVLFGFGRIGRLITRIMAEKNRSRKLL